MNDKLANDASVDERSDRPLVTFALFTYNQEKYVREAVEAAFAQGYQPLQIILSDDCSTDSTFAVLEEMVAQYNGPHHIFAQQTTRNSGTFAHVLNVAKKARGELIVLASGDDVSKPNRTSQLVNAWKSTGAWGLYSRYDRIDKTGNLFSQGEWSTSLLAPDHTLRKYFYLQDGEVNIVHGATSAYDKRLFDYLTAGAAKYILSEDGVLSLLLNILNRRIVAIDQSLVFYRSHPGSLTNQGNQPIRQTIASIKSDICKAAQYAKSCEERAEFILTFYRKNSRENLRRIDIGEIDNSIYAFEMQATWTERRFSERLRFIGDSRTKHMATWMLPRLFGQTCFIFTKFVAKNTRYLAFYLAGGHE